MKINTGILDRWLSLFLTPGAQFLCLPPSGAYKPWLFPSVDPLGTHHRPAALEFLRSISCAHLRLNSRLPERLRPSGSPSQVRTAITFLGSVQPRHDHSLHPLPVPSVCKVFLPAQGSSWFLNGTASIGTTTSTKHHVSHWCFRLSAVGYTTFKHPLILLIKTLLVSVVWMMIMLCLHNKLHNGILISVISISMMFNLNKHMYDIMIILCKSYL